MSFSGSYEFLIDALIFQQPAKRWIEGTTREPEPGLAVDRKRTRSAILVLIWFVLICVYPRISAASVYTIRHDLSDERNFIREVDMRLRSLIALTFVLAFAACGSIAKKPPTVGETKDFATVCDKGNDGKRVAVTGYLRFPEEVNRKIGLVLRLYKTTDYSGQPIGVSSEIGSQPNQVGFMPKEYSDKDLKVYLANGQTAGFGTKVKVSGDVYFPLVGQMFVCALSNPLVELSQ